MESKGSKGMGAIGGSVLDHANRQALIVGVEEAGQDVIKIYQRDFSIDAKADDSPLTEADMASHHALVAMLDRENA